MMLAFQGTRRDGNMLKAITFETSFIKFTEKATR